MKTIKIICLISVMALGGCSAMDTMKPALTSLKGKPVQSAFNVLGFPDGEQAIAGRKVYTWGTNYNSSITLPNTSNSTTYVNGTPIYSTTTAMETTPINVNCKIRVIATNSDIIESWDAEGNEYGCAPYAEKLKVLVPKKAS